MPTSFVQTFSHHSIPLRFSSWMFSLFISSNVQKESSGSTGLSSVSSHIGSARPFNLMRRRPLVKLTVRSLLLVPVGRSTVRYNSERVCVHTYFPGTVPPLPRGGGTLSSALLSSCSPAGDTGSAAAEVGTTRFPGISVAAEGGSTMLEPPEISNPPESPISTTSGSATDFSSVCFFLLRSSSSVLFFFLLAFFSSSLLFFSISSARFPSAV
mmetsp:Transcript_20128/g.40067  ORF Transcript_20128/g.40067 Transcript_20128/m.40067 type:complete len:212 (-) Transcript_20128:273-908(-)